ncbi:uncharacterized protein V6R79_023768 [Siganus canaliculatus]
MRAIPVPSGLVTCPWGAFRLGTESRRERERTVAHSSVGQQHLVTRLNDPAANQPVTDSSKLLRLPTVILTASVTLLPAAATSRHTELSRRTEERKTAVNSLRPSPAYFSNIKVLVPFASQFIDLPQSDCQAKPESAESFNAELEGSNDPDTITP